MHLEGKIRVPIPPPIRRPHAHQLNRKLPRRPRHQPASRQRPAAIGTAVLKQLMDNQKMQAEALIKMINATHPPSLDGTGENVNVGA